MAAHLTARKVGQLTDKNGQELYFIASYAEGCYAAHVAVVRAKLHDGAHRDHSRAVMEVDVDFETWASRRPTIHDIKMCRARNMSMLEHETYSDASFLG